MKAKSRKEFLRRKGKDCIDDRGKPTIRFRAGFFERSSGRGGSGRNLRPIQDSKKADPVYKEHVRRIWFAPIRTAPFYALEMYPCLLNTHGGPRRNTRAQILDAFGKPIPRLCSAGELGSLWGIIYQGAGNNAESMVFGRIAGRNAAAEKSRG